jgi:hypothetical protein
MFRTLKTYRWVLVIVLVVLTGILVVSFTGQEHDLVSAKSALEAAAGNEGPVYVALGGGQERLEVGPDRPGKGVSHLAGGLDLHRGEEPNSPAEAIIDGKGAEIILERAGGAPVICVGEGVTLFLRNITITGRKDNNAPLVRVSGAGAKLVLEDGAVIRNNSNDRANEAGGIVVGIGGSLEMAGGEIRGNRGTGRISSGGVYAAGDFILTGGTISGNRGGYGGGVYMNKSRFEMRGGTISGNAARYGGGGVYMDKSGFEMRGGTISGNQAVDGGGVLARAAFEMNGGMISGNSATVMGGGVYVTGSFEMRGGTIGGNDAVIGGGVYTAVKGRIEKAGGGMIYGTGSLMGNTATGGSGHAVYVAGGGKMRNSGVVTGDRLDSGTDAGWYF